MSFLKLLTKPYSRLFNCREELNNLCEDQQGHISSDWVARMCRRTVCVCSGLGFFQGWLGLESIGGPRGVEE